METDTVEKFVGISIIIGVMIILLLFITSAFLILKSSFPHKEVLRSPTEKDYIQVLEAYGTKDDPVYPYTIKKDDIDTILLTNGDMRYSKRMESFGDIPKEHILFEGKDLEIDNTYLTKQNSL